MASSQAYNNNFIGNEENNPNGAQVRNLQANKASTTTSSCQPTTGAVTRALGDITNTGRSNLSVISTTKPTITTTTTNKNNNNNTCHIAVGTTRAHHPNPPLRIRRTDGAIAKHSPTGSRLSNLSVAALKAAVGAPSSSPMATSATAPRRLGADSGTGASATAVAAASVKCKLDFAAPSALDDYFNRSNALPYEESDEQTIPEGVLDIDRDDIGNSLYAAEYAQVIHSTFLGRETAFMVDPQYMDHQDDVTIKMRSILIDWLVDVHGKFKLRPETLFLTVNIIDRYLQAAPVLRRKLQLVGVCAMLIASKYEEIYPPEISDFVFIADRAYCKREIISMEGKMLRQLGFEVTIPHALPFMYRSLKAAHKAMGAVSIPHEHMAQYMIELSLLNTETLQFRPSLVAAAACRLAGSLSRPNFYWDLTMVFHSGGYHEEDLADCEMVLRKLVAEDADIHNANRLTAVKRKFSTTRFSTIATMTNRLIQEPVFGAAPADVPMEICSVPRRS